MHIIYTHRYLRGLFSIQIDIEFKPGHQVYESKFHETEGERERERGGALSYKYIDIYIQKNRYEFHQLIGFGLLFLFFLSMRLSLSLYVCLLYITTFGYFSENVIETGTIYTHRHRNISPAPQNTNIRQLFNQFVVFWL